MRCSKGCEFILDEFWLRWLTTDAESQLRYEHWEAEVMRRGMGSLLRDGSLGLGILTFIVGVGMDPSGSFAQTAESGAPKFFANNEGAYSGGRGLITASGPTGMFLNPTSGTLTKGAISAQVFGSIIKPMSTPQRWARPVWLLQRPTWLRCH